jgi:hypothetical protein
VSALALGKRCFAEGLALGKAGPLTKVCITIYTKIMNVLDFDLTPQPMSVHAMTYHERLQR